MKKLLNTLLIFFVFLSVANSAFAIGGDQVERIRNGQSAQGAAAPGVLNLCPVNPTTESGTKFSQLCTVDPSNVLGTVITFIFIIAIIVALIYLIWGGIKWITSGGDKGNVETARNQIIAAVIGLIVVFLSYFILNIVLQVFLGMDVNSIGLPSLPDATP